MISPKLGSFFFHSSIIDFYFFAAAASKKPGQVSSEWSKFYTWSKIYNTVEISELTFK